MSEVMSYYAGNIDADRKVYLSADFDRVTAERDAALGREAALRLELEEMVRRATAALSNLSFTKNELSDTREAYLHQSARLTAADERADVLEGLLNSAQGHIGDASLSRDIDAALKPAEGGGDEPR